VALHPGRVGPLALVALAAACGGTGNIVAGDPDTHCGETVQTIDPTLCDGADAGEDVFGATLFNSDGQDDDCKYHLSFTHSTIERDEDVSFTVSAWALDGSASVTGAKVRADAFMDDGHAAPDTGATTVENPPGTYTVGPIQFDKKGRWTVRFHLFEDCAVGAASPHGHAAFYVDVP
jgi:hypothetical protein